jgi:aminoglycoside phosphotransferase (APT) family kinase protein
MPKPDIDPKAVRSILGRAFPGNRDPSFTRMTSGGSTQVYRVDLDDAPVFLRFGEDPEDTFAPEAFVHDRLIELGVLVPRVIHIEEQAPEAERSVMITTAIPGSALSIGGMGSDGASRHSLDVLREAGRQLALINCVETEGFGFVDRSMPWSGVLTGKSSTFREWTKSITREYRTLGRWFSDAEIRAIDRCIVRVVSRQLIDISFLAHGDFDTSHIFALGDAYTGIIDFGEIRGADRYYDLADFIVHANLERDGKAVTALVGGYSEMFPLFAEEFRGIEERAVTIGVAMMIRIRDRDAPQYRSDLAQSIRRLLNGEYLSGLIAG